MSTTVTYKGSTLTTVDNQTRTLKTAGKYMEGDVVLTDVTSSGGVPHVWQDQDGYVHLDDEGTTQIVVEPLSVTQNGTYTASTGYAYSPVTVNVSGGGGGGASKKQINFIDYDGTVVESYTKTEWQSVSALPSNPSHTGLTAQGWNWTKAEIDAQLTAIPDGDVWVGQMYITDDGKTRIYIQLEEGRLHPYLGIGVNGTVVVDWGDNSETSTLTGTSLTTLQTADHTYASDGSYMIALTVSSGSFSFYGTNGTAYILRKDNTTTSQVHRVYANAIQKIELGSNAKIGDYAFFNCHSLASITIPSSIPNFSIYNFYYCSSLVSITIPNTVTSVGNSEFCYCVSLVSVSIPNSVRSFGKYALMYCYSLASVTIPNSITSFSERAFYGCCALSSVIMPSGATSVPSYMFYDCSSLVKVTLPNSVTTINSYVFSNCYTLVSLTIPSSVTTINNSTFEYCYGMAEYHFLSTTPPTLGTSAFVNIQSDCIIYVPAESLEAYKTATNWSAYADYMQGE